MKIKIDWLINYLRVLTTKLCYAHVNTRDVNKATEYKAKAKARTFKAKATNISPRPGQGQKQIPKAKAKANVLLLLLHSAY